MQRSNEARKKAEAQKAQKKAIRDAKVKGMLASVNVKPGAKGRSAIPQSKKSKR